MIDLVYGSGATIGDAALGSPQLAGIHFTGRPRSSTGCGAPSASNMERFRDYPRIVGETGGKDFIVAHPSADVDALATAIVRGSFEYQGQKCSASSRIYAPSNLWPELRERLQEQVATITMGDVSDFGNFMGAVIDSSSFRTQAEAIEEAKANAEHDIVVGGGYDDSRGLLRRADGDRDRDPDFRTMREELFGPVVTTYVYDESKWDDTLELVDQTAPYGLTGAVFSEDRAAAARRAAEAPLRGRQLLRQRQADRRRRRPAAVRRRERLGHERQGRLDVEPDPLGQPALDQGDVLAADELPLPVPGRRAGQRRHLSSADAERPGDRRRRGRRCGRTRRRRACPCASGALGAP